MIAHLKYLRVIYLTTMRVSQIKLDLILYQLNYIFSEAE